MPNAITDLLESARILAKANNDQMLCYLIDMALHEAHESKAVSTPIKRAA
jgi:hypothetical protein